MWFTSLAARGLQARDRLCSGVNMSDCKSKADKKKALTNAGVSEDGHTLAVRRTTPMPANKHKRKAKDVGQEAPLSEAKEKVREEAEAEERERKRRKLDAEQQKTIADQKIRDQLAGPKPPAQDVAPPNDQTHPPVQSARFATSNGKP